MIIEQLWLDGDYELIDDEDNFIAVFVQINAIFRKQKSRIFSYVVKKDKGLSREKGRFRLLNCFRV